MSSTTQESATARTYANEHYSIVVSKFRDQKPMISFFNGVSFTAVYVERKEAAYSLKRFKKNLAAENKIA